MMRYEVEVLRTGFFTQALDPRKLVDVLNQRSAAGWSLSRTIKEEQRRLFSRREAHFLIFEKES